MANLAFAGNGPAELRGLLDISLVGGRDVLTVEETMNRLAQLGHKPIPTLVTQKKTIDQPEEKGYTTSDAEQKPRPTKGAKPPAKEVAATPVLVPLWRLLEEEFQRQRVLRVLARMNREKCS